MTIVEKIMAHSKPNPTTGCIEWQRATTVGYGRIKHQGKLHLTHRAVAQHRLNGGEPIPRNIDVCHTCDNPACVNPDHLFLGSRSENMVDCSRKGRMNAKPGIEPILTERHVDQVTSMRRRGMSQRAIGEVLGCSRYAVESLRKRFEIA